MSHAVFLYMLHPGTRWDNAKEQMIPAFPRFKQLALSDQKEIEAITRKFPPYSDYNFISLWSWNTTNGISISLLNANLVVRFTDYLTGNIFYSFFGTNQPNETATELILLSIKEGLHPTLQLIPEISITGVNSAMFSIAEDRDSFDYIYDIDSFLKMEGGKFEAKQRQKRYFESNFSCEIAQLDLSQPIVKDMVMDLCHEWARNKVEQNNPGYFDNEFLALLRFLNGAYHRDHLALGVYHKSRLIAISFGENTNDGFHTCHFQKALTSSYKGLNVFLVNHVAKTLATHGIQFINWEQDLGIPGLRESKSSYQPCTFLKKYTLSTVQN